MRKVKCSQCKYLQKGEGKESFITPQGILTTVYRGRFYCEADISERFTDEQILIHKECQNFRSSTIKLYQEVFADIKNRMKTFCKIIAKKIWTKII